MYSSLRLKNLMEQRKISIKKLSLDLNLSEEDIRLYQNNIFNADIKVLILLAEYFNVSIDYLMARTDNPDSHKKKLKAS